MRQVNQEKEESKGETLTLLVYYFLRNITAATMNPTTTPTTAIAPTVKISKPRRGVTPPVVVVVVVVVVTTGANPPGTYGSPFQTDPIVSLEEELKRGKIKDGDVVVLTAAGIGWSWNAMTIQWGKAGARRR